MENLGLIVSIGLGVFTIVGSMIAMMLWVRGEANADRKETNGEITQLRRDLIDCVRAIENEIKDFHGRLCTIEENRGKP